MGAASISEGNSTELGIWEAPSVSWGVGVCPKASSVETEAGVVFKDSKPTAAALVEVGALSVEPVLPPVTSDGVIVSATALSLELKLPRLIAARGAVSDTSGRAETKEGVVYSIGVPSNEC